MNKFRLIGLAITLLAPFVWQPAQAEMVVLGTASTGETLTLDTDSVSLWTPMGTGLFISATYYLDNERIDASISCRNRSWVVEGDSTHYTPQSQATQNLISTACRIAFNSQSRQSNQSQQTRERTWIIYDPPSNVRYSPNGEVLCTIGDKRRIQIRGNSVNGWYRTPACEGADGWIHESQIKLVD
ncbi:hypothetical protein [Planktothrix mougeotii]|uniref:SH3b domain-containing protein n=1 Tax=Planktothrix mougeotii LEGE 06226 TaxID=1828728 RepID=A0ABR9UCE0_9CYAN|nr:hypothetical protein [Planktothrix mougeotii]MBE9144087.1 hypothetical protein [Planktothrix mougeotii LEGE 06226]